MSSRPPSAPKPKTKVFSDFTGGVNLTAARHKIKDNQCSWLEGAQPLADGYTPILNGPVNADFGQWIAKVGGESTAPSFMYTFNVAGTDYVFAVFSLSGNGYIGDANGISVTKFFAGNLTSGQTAATVWNNKGLLIVDPAGYWDWNVSTAATLTALNNSVQSVTITDGGSGFTAFPSVALSGGGGSGATLSVAYMGLGSVQTINSTGTNYKVGDILTLAAFNVAQRSPSQLTVTTVNATGGVTGVSVSNPGAGFGTFGTFPAVSGGSGTGCTMTVSWVVTEVDVATRGSGYTGPPSITFSGGGPPTRQATATSVVSGSLAGTAVAAYAGRVWIASGRTVTFTDVNSYNTFIVSGSSFTINDNYLHNNITALFTANNYLYIFGPDSIDVLSNVTVSASGTASFSRVNVTAAVGTDQPNSIFSYYRSVAFAATNGFYLLSGSSPEKIDDVITPLVAQIDFSTYIYNSISGGQVTLNNELCAAWQVNFTDIFMSGGAFKSILLIYSKGRWFFSRQCAVSGTPLQLGPIVSIPSNASSRFGLYTIASDKNYYQLFQISDTTSFWRIRTKLVDGEAPMTTKQAVRAAMGCTMGGIVATRSGLSLTVDTEIHDPGQATTLISGTLLGYQQLQGANNEGSAPGSLFMGLGANGVSATQADISTIAWLAFQYTELGEWLA